MLMMVIGLAGCDRGVLFEQFVPLDKKGWGYEQVLPFELEVQDVSVPYDVFINLRHTNDYPYANLWIMVYSYPPDGGTPTQQRMELKLATNDGKWLGTGLGANVNHQIKVRDMMKFQAPGKYSLAIQHDMRVQSVPALTHFGITVAKSK